MPSVHTGLRYGYVFLVLTRFRLLVGMRGFWLICTIERKAGQSTWVGYRIDGTVRADRLNATESPIVLFVRYHVVGA